MRSGVTRAWTNPVDAQALLWTAPEILRRYHEVNGSDIGTQKGDVYRTISHHFSIFLLIFKGVVSA
jgi:hypothetical protein